MLNGLFSDAAVPSRIGSSLTLRTLGTVIWTVAMLGGLAGCTTANDEYCLYSGLCDVATDLGVGGDLGENGDGDLGQTDGGNKGDGSVPVGTDPSLPGPNSIATIEVTATLSNGATKATVIGPSEDRRTLSTKGPFPTVIFSPDAYTDRHTYANYGELLASYGILTVLQNAPIETDRTKYRDSTKELIDWMLDPSGADGDAVRGRTDVNHLGITGHGLGARIGILVAALDKRVRSSLAIDPVDGTTPPARDVVGMLHFPDGLPVGFLGETISKTMPMGMGRQPCTPSDLNYEAIYAKASSPSFAITLSGAAHNDFLDTCTFQCGTCPGSTAPKDRTHRLALKYVAAYFLWTLKGAVDERPYVDGSELQKDVMAGYVTNVSK